MAITDANKARLNKMNKAAQDAALGTVIQDLQNYVTPEVADTVAAVDVLKTNVSYRIIDGTTGKKACAINGVTLITGGTGIADLTLAAPAVNSHAIIRVDTLTSGNVVVTTAAGVTIGGTGTLNTITMNAADDWIELIYCATNKWAVVRSNSVSLTTV